MQKLRTISGWAGLALCVTAGPLLAQTPVVIGCVTSTDCAAAAIAAEDGIFARHGLEARIEVINNNANVPAGLLSNSLQVGSLTMSIFLQAVDGGVDLVAISGGTSLTLDTADGVAVAVSPGSELTTPADFVGKTVAVPALNTNLHVLFVRWLMDADVDPGSVNFVEMPLPSMGDALVAGSIQAGTTAEPLLSRMIAAGVAEVGSYFLENVPDPTPTVIYSTSRAWAEANPDAVAAFRAAIAEGSAIADADAERARAAVSSLTGVPLAVLQNVKIATPAPDIDPAGLQWWVDAMGQQNLLMTQIDVQTLVLQ